ncbi:hypothetical protein ACP275_04G158000 [Erythranthe tilingii]
MAAYAALVSLTTTMDHIQNHPLFSISFDKIQMESLGEKIRFLLDFIEADYSHGVTITSKQVEILESQIAAAAYAAEDVIESHVVDRIHATKDSKRNSMPLGSTESDPLHQIHGGSVSSVDLQTVIEEIDSIKNKVMEFKDEIGSKDDRYMQQQQPTCSMVTTTSTPPGKNTMVGFDEQLLRLLDKLTGQQSNRQVIPIVGMGGIGKTTLAKNAYEHSVTMHRFDIRTWVTVSQKYNVRELFVQLHSRLVSTEINGEIDEQLLGQKLHKILWGRRYLIVIDDIWSIEAWEEVCRFFPDNNNGSRIVVTTRISNVATHFDSACFELTFLDEDKSWKLFCEKAFGQVGCPSELEDIGKEIVKKCKGLPLSISVIGGLLGRSNRTHKYWKNIAKDLTSILNSGEDENCLSILSLSYTYLPVYLKPCFLYMAIFPEDHDIRVSRLIKLWVAEGFIKPNESQSLEEIARGYINDLIDRNLILKQHLGSNRKIQFCEIHDLLRDLCLKIVHKDKFMCMMEENPGGVESERRIVCNRKGVCCRTLQLAPLTRTLVTSTDGRLSNNRLLRVMSFNDKAKKKYLLRHIVDQVNMRYLAYNEFNNSPSSVKLPTSIDVLWNLQTIIIGREIEAPSQIWEMRQLMHVDIRTLYLPDPPQNQNQDEFILQNLQKLANVTNFVWSEEACKRVVNVRKLHIEYDNDSKSSNDYSVHNISRLRKLESLTFFPYGLPNLLQKLTFPSSLKKLHLDCCNVRWEDLSVIGSLPYLEVLNLNMCWVEGEMWYPVEGEFLRLKFLSILCFDIVYWNADCSHFPVLEKLELIGMDKLEEIPLDIGEIPTLELVKLYGCTESAAISAMKIAVEQENNGNDILRVQVDFDTKEQLESFKKKVEQLATSFTGNNFQANAYF